MENVIARKMSGSGGNLRGQNGSSSIHLKRQLLLYRNNCKGRFAWVQYVSNNRFFSGFHGLESECWHVVLLLFSA